MLLRRLISNGILHGVLASLLFSCGGPTSTQVDNKKPSGTPLPPSTPTVSQFSGLLGTCTHSSNVTGVNISLCHEYRFDGKFKADPTAELKAGIGETCPVEAKKLGIDGKFAPDATCEADLLVGYCDISIQEMVKEESATITATYFFRSNIYKLPEAQRDCKEMEGTFRAP